MADRRLYMLSALLAVPIVLASGWVMTTSTLTAYTSKAGSATYGIREIPGLSGSPQRTTIAGFNDRGDIVGTLFGRHHHAFLYRAGRLMNLGVPRGFSHSAAQDINHAGVISAQASGDRQRTFPFAVVVTGRHVRWIRLPVVDRGRVTVTVGDIAANGDIVGTLFRSVRVRSHRRNVQRAVVWIPSARSSYRTARVLPLSRHFRSSSASAIWSIGKRLVIAGEQGRPGFATFGTLTLWSPRPSFVAAGSSGGLPVVSRLGGWHSNVYATGTFLGVDTSSGWKARINFARNGSAHFGSIEPLGTPYSCVEHVYTANDVNASPRGRFVGVGSISCLSKQKPQTALIWHGSGVSKLQGLIARPSGWRLQSGEAINRRGQIVGMGRLRGEARVFLMTPLASSR